MDRKRRALVLLCLTIPVLPGFEDWAAAKGATIDLDYSGIETFRITVDNVPFNISMATVKAALREFENAPV